MNRRQRENDYINVAEVMSALIRHLSVIILSGILFGLAGFIYSAYIATPLYNASAMMIVNSGERYDYVTQDQLNSATSLVETYSVIITSDTVMDEVYSNLGMEDTYKSTVKDISVSAVNETQIMKITVTAIDPAIALDVCEEITNVCPDVIVKTVKAGSVELVSKARTTYKQVSPNVKKNTVLAVAFGVLFLAALVTFITVMDNKVNGENDIKQLDLPLIGVIPYYDLEGK